MQLGIAYNQMLDRIEDSVEKLIQFSDDIAHELRTPINNLMGEAEIILSRAATHEEYQQVTGSILEELTRIYQIVENILFLARAENPQMELQKAPINVAAATQMMVRFYQAMADEKNIKIMIEGDEVIVANEIMFRRLMGNLLSNAIKYSNNNDVIHIAIMPMSDSVQITVKDNGIGIAAEHVPMLFQRFFRSDISRSQLSGGTGLGLAIAKSIVDLHSGTIAVRSVVNGGTTFTILLPVHSTTQIL